VEGGHGYVFAVILTLQSLKSKRTFRGLTFDSPPTHSRKRRLLWRISVCRRRIFPVSKILFQFTTGEITSFSQDFLVLLLQLFPEELHFYGTCCVGSNTSPFAVCPGDESRCRLSRKNSLKGCCAANRRRVLRLPKDFGSRSSCFAQDDKAWVGISRASSCANDGARPGWESRTRQPGCDFRFSPMCQRTPVGSLK